MRSSAGHVAPFRLLSPKRAIAIARGLENDQVLIAFSEPPSETTWLENARAFDRIFRAAKWNHLA
jgi:hypothetical protein